MDEKTVQMPVGVLSYSALTQLLRNPLIFKLKHILNVYDGKMSVSGMIGRAGHEALKTYYGGNPDMPLIGDRDTRRNLSIEQGLKYLDQFDDQFISYGKTGSREAMLKGYTQAMNFYFAEEPDYHEILMCEEKMSAELKTLEGEALPLPATGVPDLVTKTKEGRVQIIDTKFVTAFTDWETEDYMKIVQGEFLFHLLLASKGIKADDMIFREIKRSENKDGSPQVRDWTFPFDHAQYRIIFYNLFKDVARFLANPNAIYLPNLSDPFDGEQAGLLYAQGLISADMSDVEVMHKVKDVAFASKKFVASRLDKVENKYLPPEERVRVRLSEFGVPVEHVETRVSPSVTQYRFKVSRGIRMSTFKKHIDDIKLALEAKGEVRILAPIEGTSLVGIEVENATRTAARLDDKHLKPGTLSLPIGMDVEGNAVTALLNDMPHLLIAGATGSGKSVLLHGLITALTKQMQPDEMELLLIDPKRVELSAFDELPHLREKVIYEYADAVKALMGLTDEMEARYKLLKKAKVRDIAAYNKGRRSASARLPYIVAVFDEFADFMIRSTIEESKGRGGYGTHTKEWLAAELERRGRGNPPENMTKAGLIEALEELDSHDEMKRADANVELLVVRLAQMARAVGIHLIIATQRPSVDVITGLIKANFPTRIALTTASPTDSEVILGKRGAEKLSGKGDMLFMHPANRGEIRLQGFMI